MKRNEHKYCLRNERPKVLLLGNGLTRNSGGLSWNEAIQEISKDGSKLKRFMKNPDNIKDGYTIPYTPLALVTAPFDDKERRQKYVEVFNQKDYLIPPVLDRLIALPFSAILTTNYTYEVENALLSGFSNLKQAVQLRKCKSFHQGNTADTYLIERCNIVSPSSPQVWHIHGETNRKSSIVLTHDEYARLISSMLRYLREQGNRYYETIEEFEFRSWIDYILMADVYTVGLSFDFAEFDLWWMLGRRKREKAPTGRIIFYEYESDCKNSKQEALRALGIEVRCLGFNSQNKKNYASVDGFYNDFYKAAIDDIENELKSGLKEAPTHV